MEKCSGSYIQLNNKLNNSGLSFFELTLVSLPQLDGSLIIVAEHVMGSMRIDESDEPILQYGQR